MSILCGGLGDVGMRSLLSRVVTRGHINVFSDSGSLRLWTQTSSPESSWSQLNLQGSTVTGPNRSGQSTRTLSLKFKGIFKVCVQPTGAMSRSSENHRIARPCATGGSVEQDGTRLHQSVRSSSIHTQTTAAGRQRASQELARLVALLRKSTFRNNKKDPQTGHAHGRELE